MLSSVLTAASTWLLLWKKDCLFFLNAVSKSFARSEVLQHNDHILLRCENVGFANPQHFF